jgi:putative iron-regulated protein
MKKYALLSLVGAAFFATTFTSCKSDKKTDPAISFDDLKVKVLSDFGTTLVTPMYSDFQTKATTLKTAVETLAATPTQANLLAARSAWQDVRVVWEQSEGFLIGPVEDDYYDPYMDTWPTDHNAMDSLLAGTQPLTANYLSGVGVDSTKEAELTLRGFHPLEYMLWDLDGNRQASSFTQREKDYMVALANDILNNVNAIKTKGTAFFVTELALPGVNGSRYTSKHDAMEALANGLSGIIDEEGDNKMVEPFNPTPDSTVTESPYSHNSIADFKNNIIGARNAYTCTNGTSSGKSLSDLVKANNASLDQEIKQKFDIAINSFDGITTTFEKAVYNQRSQVQNTLTALSSLKETVDAGLVPYIQQYVKD